MLQALHKLTPNRGSKGDAEVSPPIRWYARPLLCLLAVLLLSLAFAPAGQFYLAWIGLVPWLYAISRTRSARAVFLWSWACGTGFFLTNMWWLYKVTGPGMMALVMYLGLFWGVVGLIFRAGGLLPRARVTDESIPQTTAMAAVRSVLLAPLVWCALEWVRGNWSMFGEQGLPWLFIGHSQSPLLVMCQVADLGSAYAVSFWVVMVNMLVFWMMAVPRGPGVTRAVGPAFVVVLLIAAIGGYGWYRLAQTPGLTKPGPTVLVVQSNYPQSNTGEKGAPRAEIVRFHVAATRTALATLDKQGTHVDLIAWSETMMPALNRSAREFLANSRDGQLLHDAHAQIASLAAEHGAAVIAGGIYADKWQTRGDYVMPADRRNSAYFFDSNGLMSDHRYDKIHLVPFGEFIPFGSSGPIYNLLVKLGPQYYEDYILTPGSRENITVFDVAGARFVVPICFEDIVSPLVAEMVRAKDEGNIAGKRVDFLVNLTNDGWFGTRFRWASQMPQHLQAATFRSIENRVPTARAVNTGVSGFIDSVGRTHGLVPAAKEDWGAAQLKLDSRVTIYTRYGDVFGFGCAVITAVLIAISALKKRQGGPK